jgi:ribosomal protein S18 acetylase RimI-like enzyme
MVDREKPTMPIRNLALPNDLEPLSEMVAETFQYPDNPEWSVQADEVESMAASMKNYRRMWPVIQLIQWLSPALRDILHGHIWEEDGQIVGFTNIGRQGTTDVWYVSGVGVRPEYRRRGIARQLVSASLEMIRERGGRIALLDVIDGNYPAYKLYQNLGFETYAGTLMLELEPHAAPVSAPRPLPEGYVQEDVSLFEWRSRYALAHRATPEHILVYEPVQESRYRRPPTARLLMPLLLRADGLKAECFVIRTAAGEVVAYGRSEARVREKGRNEINASLDPAHGELAPYLIQALLYRVNAQSPGRIVEMSLSKWQSALTGAAKEVGFEQRTRMHRMGILLKE